MRIGLGIGTAGLGIELMDDDLRRLHHVLGRDAQRLGDGLVFPLFQVREMLVDDLLYEGAAEIELSRLDEKTFPEVPRSHAGGIEVLNQFSARSRSLCGRLACCSISSRGERRYPSSSMLPMIHSPAFTTPGSDAESLSCQEGDRSATRAS